MKKYREINVVIFGKEDMRLSESQWRSMNDIEFQTHINEYDLTTPAYEEYLMADLAIIQEKQFTKIIKSRY